MADLLKLVKTSKNPVTVRRAAKFLGVAYTTAERHLLKLAKTEGLKRVKVREGRRGLLSRAWVAT